MRILNNHFRLQVRKFRTEEPEMKYFLRAGNAPISNPQNRSHISNEIAKQESQN